MGLEGHRNVLFDDREGKWHERLQHARRSRGHERPQRPDGKKGAPPAASSNQSNEVNYTCDYLVSVMSTTAAGMGQLNTNYPQKVLAGDLSPDFPIFMAIKDLTMALELAQTSESPARFGILARTILRDAEAHGMGDLDQTAVLKFLEKAGG